MKPENIVRVDANNLKEQGFYCSKNKKYEGHKEKEKWLNNRFDEGLGIVLAKDENGKDAGFIEYTSGEFSWRPVIADGYWVIHCIYVGRKNDRASGVGSELVSAVIKEAEKHDKLGVVAIGSDGAWLANKELFLKNGFEFVSSQGRYDLLVYKCKDGPEPRFRDWEAQLPKYQGWHLIYAHQCPFHAKAVQALAETAIEYGLDLQIMELKTPADAQAAPTGFGVFNLIYNGKVMADHYISKRRFMNILNKEIAV